MPNLLVTGATSGIGLSCVDSLAPKHDLVICMGRNFSKLESLNKSNLIFEKIDFKDSFENFALDIPKIDGVVFSCGYVKNNVLKFHDAQNLIDIINVNLISQLNFLGFLVREKLLQKNASCVFVSSLLGPHVGIPGTLAYAASKSGLEGAVKVGALELARQGIRVNSVSPGMVETELWNVEDIGSELIDADRNRYPLDKRYAKVDEVVSVIDFLLSSNSRFITGENIKVDGGYTLR